MRFILLKLKIALLTCLPLHAFAQNDINPLTNSEVSKQVLEILILEDYCRKELEKQNPEALELYRENSTFNQSVDAWADQLDEESKQRLDVFAEDTISEYGKFGCILVSGFIHGVLAAQTPNNGLSVMSIPEKIDPVAEFQSKFANEIKNLQQTNGGIIKTCSDNDPDYLTRNASGNGFRGKTFDRLEQVADLLDAKMQYTILSEWSACLKGMENGEFDVVTYATRKDDRDVYMTYFGEEKKGIYVSKKSNFITFGEVFAETLKLVK